MKARSSVLFAAETMSMRRISSVGSGTVGIRIYPHYPAGHWIINKDH